MSYKELFKILEKITEKGDIFKPASKSDMKQRDADKIKAITDEYDGYFSNVNNLSSVGNFVVYSIDEVDYEWDSSKKLAKMSRDPASLFMLFDTVEGGNEFESSLDKAYNIGDDAVVVTGAFGDRDMSCALVCGSKKTVESFMKYCDKAFAGDEMEDLDSLDIDDMKKIVNKFNKEINSDKYKIGDVSNIRGMVVYIVSTPMYKYPKGYYKYKLKKPVTNVKQLSTASCRIRHIIRLDNINVIVAIESCYRSGSYAIVIGDKDNKHTIGLTKYLAKKMRDAHNNIDISDDNIVTKRNIEKWVNDYINKDKQ